MQTARWCAAAPLAGVTARPGANPGGRSPWGSNAGTEADIERQRFINYPRGRLLAVADDAATADRAVKALVAAGWDPGAVELVSGPESAHVFDATGADHGLRARVGRLVQFTLMDQLPDLAWYEAAARDGRVVLMVSVRGAREASQVGTILAAAGAHFINRYGRFQTEQIARWRGPEPTVPDRMKH